MTDISVLPMGPGEYSAMVTEGTVTTAHRVTVPESVRDALVDVATDEERLVRESLATFLDHEKATSLPDDVSLDWIAGTVDGFFDEVRARLT